MGNLSGHLATWLGVVAAIAGGFFGLQTYRADVAKGADERVVSAFNQIEKFNAPEFRAIREKADAEAWARRICDVRAEAYQFTMNEVRSYVDFYDLVALCVDAELCEAELTATYFSSYADNVWLAFQPFVERVRAAQLAAGKTEATFGYGLERYATNPAPLDDACQANFTGVLAWDEVGP